MTDISTHKGDITTMEVDAIVNAANSRLAGGGGVDGAIHRAGGPVIAEQCRQWVSVHGHLPTGQAMHTAGGNLPARLVIHTVGPIWGDHEPEEARSLLASCYASSLDLAGEKGCTTVAFPNISTGVYGFPKREAAEVAVAAVENWANEHDAIEEVIFVCFDDENFEIYSKLLDS